MMAITKKIRFEVFKRDGFQCIYCGKTPPTVTLEVDHVNPKAKGGSDDINNLITACFDCNRGKRDIPLNKIPSQLSENLEILKEKERQIYDYTKWIKKIERRERKDINDINKIYTEHFIKWELNATFRNTSLKKFLQLLPKHVVQDALQIAISKFPEQPDDTVRYFCGICWQTIKGARNGQTN